MKPKPKTKSLGQVAFDRFYIGFANVWHEQHYNEKRDWENAAAAVAKAVRRSERKGFLCHGWMYLEHIQDFRKHGKLALLEKEKVSERLIPVTVTRNPNAKAR